ncbi:hypothetical protein K469DRAFT_704229 [Zopfia rhizophila CBS 207.26]|uniref:Uncharacterized protein n=1 Tax=Zopfia rhizophila CBS 207.26 TaxID=1314779 RepID=A0A6A6E7P9_9PEZI|nr:hypothetical protein K469DRAFT_704229 [Zopfia rhizophila CBS 207.26]
MAPIIPVLNPIPPPGLVVFPEYTALKQEALLMKETKKHWTRDNIIVSFKGPDSGIDQAFIEIDEVQKRTYVFKNVNTGQEIMRIVKEEHSLSPNVYHGMSAAGEEKWTLRLKRHSFSPTEYILQIHPSLPSQQALTLPIEPKVQGQTKAILYNGNAVATMDQPESWSHYRREDLVYVAAGFDIMVALGVSWVHIDKQREDAMAAAAA